MAKILSSQEIADMLHVEVSDIIANMTTKGGIQGLPSVAPQIYPPHSCIHFKSFNISYCISSCQSELAPRVCLPRSLDIIQVTLWVLSEWSVNTREIVHQLGFFSTLKEVCIHLGIKGASPSSWSFFPQIFISYQQSSSELGFDL